MPKAFRGDSQSLGEQRNPQHCCVQRDIAGLEVGNTQNRNTYTQLTIRPVSTALGTASEAMSTMQSDRSTMTLRADAD